MKRRIVHALPVLLAAAALTVAEARVASPGARAKTAGRTGEVNALLLVSENYGANYNLFRDEAEMMGWNLTTVGVTPTVNECFWGGPITVDTLVTELPDLSPYDALLVTFSRSRLADAHSQLLESPEALDLVSRAAAEGLLIVAHCAGTRVLAAAGVIDGKQVTGTPAFANEYEAAGAIYVGDVRCPVWDGNVVTSMDGQVNKERNCQVIHAALDALRAEERR